MGIWKWTGRTRIPGRGHEAVDACRCERNNLATLHRDPRSGDRYPCDAVAVIACVVLVKMPVQQDLSRPGRGYRVGSLMRLHLWKEINSSGVFSTAEQDLSLQRALELCEQLGDEHCRAYVACCRTRSLITQSKLDAATALNKQGAGTARDLDDSILLAAAHDEAGDVAYWRGELERASREYSLCVTALEGVDPHEIRLVLGHDPAVLALGFHGWVSWLQGRPDEARRYEAACMARAEAGGYALKLTFALAIALLVDQFRRDADAGRASKI